MDSLKKIRAEIKRDKTTLENMKKLNRRVSGLNRTSLENRLAWLEKQEKELAEKEQAT